MRICYVNGEKLEEPYIKDKIAYDFGPYNVPEDSYFMMGDNRNDSKDSRTSEIGDNGLVDVKYIVGHATLRVFPLNKFGGLN